MYITKYLKELAKTFEFKLKQIRKYIFWGVEHGVSNFRKYKN